MSRLFLGFDASTQSLTALVIDYDTRRIVYQHVLGFDSELPGYGTLHGVLPDPDPAIGHAPPLMWVEGLDRLLGRMRDDGVDLGALLSISGSGQQHGSVYLRPGAFAVFESLDASRPLAGQLGDIFSRPTSPLWTDSSTHDQCAEIRESLGGVTRTAEITGSDVFERFTASQIRKFAEEDPEAWEQTETVTLVSAFMASVLRGRLAPIDHGDGAGMNLMDIRRRSWHPGALAAASSGLSSRLPPLVAADQMVGRLHSYFAERHGLSNGLRLAAWSGDNPCSLIGVGLVEPGTAAISLGTSDTYFALMPELHTDPNGEGHVFIAPTGDPMSLICFRNGSLARERVRDTHGLDWQGFAAALRETPPGNDGKIMIPWFEPEIVPRGAVAGVRRFHGLREDDEAAECRAVVEAQLLAMRLHSQWVESSPAMLLATGGGSANPEILQVMADVFGCPVRRFETPNSAALGAALRAAHAFFRERGEDVAWGETVAGFTDPEPGSEIAPREAAVKVYDAMIETYARCEAAALAEG